MSQRTSPKATTPCRPLICKDRFSPNGRSAFTRSYYSCLEKSCQFLFPRTAGVANHKMKVQQNISRRQFRSPYSLDHRSDGSSAHDCAGLVKGCERNRQEAGVFHIVNACHSDIVRNGNAQVRQCPQKARRCEIVCTNDAFGTELLQNFFNLGLVLRVDAANLRATFELCIGHRLPIAGDSRIDCRRGPRSAEKNDTAVFASDQVLGNDISRPPVIDADQVVAAPFWIRDQICLLYTSPSPR